MTSYNQETPFCIQVELTKGCNLQCTFCGINGFQEKPSSNLNFMTVETATRIAEEMSFAGWNSRIEFAMHGEPTLNKNWIEIIGIFRQHLPKAQLMVTSNGGGIVGSKQIQKTIVDYFQAGGTILAIDEYVGIKLCDKVRAAIDEFELEDKGISIYEYPSDKRGNPHQRSNKKFVSFIAPIDITKTGTHSDLNNHCGSGGDIDISYNKKCAKPFREMSFNWDGSVNLCCNDFIGEYKCGNIHNTDIDTLWNNEYFQAARRFLMVPNRDALRPCRGCTAKSHRVGLLPDKKGKDTMSAPTDADAETVLAALAGGPDRGPTKRAKANIIPILSLEELENWEEHL